MGCGFFSDEGDAWKGAGDDGCLCLKDRLQTGWVDSFAHSRTHVDSHDDVDVLFDFARVCLYAILCGDIWYIQLGHGYLGH
jgi:hypothetical protein